MGELADKKPSTLGGFYDDLEQLLRQQLKDNPRLHDLRFKLLELYYETGRRNDFLREARSLSLRYDRKEQSVEWKRVASMGRMLGLTDPLFSEFSGDSIEFVGPVVVEKKAKTSAYQRFGDDDASRPVFQRLAEDYEKVRADPHFLVEYDFELASQANRPSPLFHARRLSRKLGGAQIYFKREDLSPAGSRLTMSTVGQALLARRLGKTGLAIATTNGVKGVVAASVAARMGLRAMIFMDQADLQRHSAHVFRMKLLGAKVTAVDRRRYPGNDIRQAALDCCVKDQDGCFLLMGLDAAPHPYAMMAREFSAVIGRECRRQVMTMAKRAPDLLAARAGNNADAIGFFDPFLAEPGTRLACIVGNQGLGDASTDAARIRDDRPNPSRPLLTESEKRVADAILEGLEYPSVAREHAFLKASGRVEYVKGSTAEAKKMIIALSREEGLVPAIETAHAIAWAAQAAQAMKPEQAIVVMLAESADKDVWEIQRAMGELV